MRRRRFAANLQWEVTSVFLAGVLRSREGLHGQVCPLWQSESQSPLLIHGLEQLAKPIHILKIHVSD